MKEIYSIGHSTRIWGEFIKKLDKVNYDYLVDVRSSPYSRFVPQYNKNRIQEQIGDKYIFMGTTLGGIDDDISYEKFIYGIEMLTELTEKNTVVFMCSEKDSNKCHRKMKISPELEKRGFNVIHL